MNEDEFRQAAGEVGDFIVDYLKGVKDRPVLPSVEPGYLHKLLPANAPQQPEAWTNIMADVKDKILPGMTHWQHPQFHAYFPLGSSYPSMLGEFLSAGLGCISFTWLASPAMTELETVMVDWLGRMMGLPRELLSYTEGGKGGGVIQKDLANGMIPFFVCATLGTVSSTAVDDIDRIGQVCAEKDMWLHVDGAYAGNVLICPEYRYLLSGFQYVSSFNSNPAKWMRMGADGTVMWVRGKRLLIDALSINRIYYLEDKQEIHRLDYRNWSIPLGRRFRSLKLWFVIRMHGVEGLQSAIRSHVALAKLFESWVLTDDMFEVVGTVEFGLVCFRIKGENALTEVLLKRINESGKAHMVPASLKGKYVIRFTPANWYYSEDITKNAWDIVTDLAGAVLRDIRSRGDGRGLQGRESTDSGTVSGKEEDS